MAQSQVWSPKHPAFQSLLTALAAATSPVYIVGGVVRDYLLGQLSGSGRTHNDLDVVAPHPVMETARRVADALGWAFYPLDLERDVARLVFTAASQPLVCDIAAMRGGSIESDLLARDFTINAMAVEWQGRRATQVIDLAGGRADLAQRLLRRVTPSSLAEDPVRLLRAVRFAAQLGFTIEEETEQQILRMAETIRLTSAERIRDELWKIMQSPAPEAAIEQMRRYNLLRPVLPEVAAMEGVTQSPPHTLDVYAHSLRTVACIRQFRNWLLGEAQAGPASEATPAAALWRQRLEPWRYRLRQHFLQPMAAEHLRVDWLTWFALLHDIGKPETRSLEETPAGERIRYFNHESVGAAMAVARLNELRFSRQEIMLAQGVIAHHMRPHLLHASFGADRLSRRACYRFFRDSGGQTFDNFPGVDIVLLALADYQATCNAPLPPDWETYLAHACDLLEFAFHADGLEQARTPLVDGHTLMRYFSLKPGPQVGDLLERIQEAQAAGEVHDAEEALALAASWILDRKE